jgi:hypothetical protein
MFRELRLSAEGKGDAIEALSNMVINADGTIVRHAPRKSFAQAASQIVVVDVSMSLNQCAGCCRRRARASHCSDHWAWLVGCAHGIAATISLGCCTGISGSRMPDCS